MCLHYSILTSVAELEQLRRGLSIQKFNTLMEQYPQTLRKAFAPSEITITSDFIQDMFCPVFLPLGSNRRIAEEALAMVWIQYLQQLQGT